MRTIKFRGKRLDNNEWVYGYYVHQNKSHEIFLEDTSNVISASNHVNPETVGQFTGLHDKDGNEIYEGDLLKNPAKDKWEEANYSCFEVFFHDGDSNSDYNIGYSMNRMYNHGVVCGGYIPSCKPKTLRNMVIIGNIHDNPELIKEDK